jgi:NAD+ kinase
MKVCILTAHHHSEAVRISHLLRKFGFELVESKPDLVVACGGDGTILYSERVFPGVPKLVIKTTRLCRKYDYAPADLDKIIQKIKNNDYDILHEMKLEAYCKNDKLVGLNEIQIRNRDPTRAIRFSVSAARKKFDLVIGDGVIISTPFGSTGYYAAAGGTEFKKGIGVCFNNPHPRAERAFVIPENSEVKVKIIRDRGHLAADNDEKLINVKAGDTVLIRKSKQLARFVLVRGI